MSFGRYFCSYGIWQITPSACGTVHDLASIIDFGCHLISAHSLFGLSSCIFGSSKSSSCSGVKWELELIHFQWSLLVHDSCSLHWTISNELNWLLRFMFSSSSLYFTKPIHALDILSANANFEKKKVDLKAKWMCHLLLSMIFNAVFNVQALSISGKMWSSLMLWQISYASFIVNFCSLLLWKNIEFLHPVCSQTSSLTYT